MDQAHLHLLLNHFPILGILFGAALLTIGIIKKNNFLIKLSQLFFIIIVLITIPAYLTGDGAGDIVKKYSDVSESVIDTHEDLALIAFIIAIVLGVLSALNLYLHRYNEIRFKKASYLICGLSYIVFAFMIFVGKTGGLIHHPELRNGTEIQKTSTPSTEEHKEH